MFGYLQDALDTPAGRKREAMLRHLCDLMGDSPEYSWASARNSHGVFLQKMETGKLSWKRPEQLATTRVKYSRLQPVIGSAKTGTNSTSSTKGPLFCIPFQDGRCKHSDREHDSSRGRVHHICTFCCKQGSVYKHPEADCRRKAASTADKQ